MQHKPLYCDLAFIHDLNLHHVELYLLNILSAMSQYTSIQFHANYDRVIFAKPSHKLSRFFGHSKIEG